MEGRRASGTRTWFDVLKSWAGRGHTYNDDVRDLAAGVPLTVVARLRRDGEERWSNGKLVLRRDTPAEWRGRGGPVTVERGTVAAPRPMRLFSDIYVTSGGKRIELRIPAADVRLVTEALSQ